jgi:hypothetical protein
MFLVHATDKNSNVAGLTFNEYIFSRNHLMLACDFLAESLTCA